LWAFRAQRGSGRITSGQFGYFVALGSDTQSHQVLAFPGKPVASTSGFSQLSSLPRRSSSSRRQLLLRAVLCMKTAPMVSLPMCLPTLFDDEEVRVVRSVDDDD
jgi:hypothetical protein